MEKNMTQGSPWKHILFFSLPILGGMVLQLMYTTVDGIIVGNFVGDTALGAMNTSTSYASLLLAVSTGLSTGSGIVLAQFYGAGKRAEMRSCAATMRILLLGIGAVILVFGFLSSKMVLRNVLGVPDDVLVYADAYMRVYFLGMVFQFAYNAFAAELRSVGDSGATMKFLLISSVANIIFDFLFVVAMDMGVAGAALGTVLAQGISAVVSFMYIKKRHALLWIPREEMRFSGEMCRMTLRMGIPVMIQTIISSLGNLAIQRLINSFGSSTMAAVAAGGRVEGYAIMPNVAFASGMATYAGQNAGAGDLKRVWKGMIACLVICCAVCVFFSVVLQIFAEGLVSAFGCTGDSLVFGVKYLRFMARALIIMTVLFVCRGMLQGVGDVTVTTVITFVTLAIRIVFAYAAAEIPGIGRDAIYLCMGVDFVIGAVFYVIRLASGRWKKKIIVKQEAAGASET